MALVRKIGLFLVVLVLIVVYIKRTNKPPPTIPNNETVATPISAPTTTKPVKRGRYLRIKSTSADGYVNVSAMTASFEGRQYRPVTGEVKPLLNENFNWQNLIDDNPSTFAHTDLGVGYILLDLGADYSVDRISVLNRNETYTGENAKYNSVIRDRIVGHVLTLEDASMNVVWKHVFTSTGERWDFDIY